ncbi:MAG: zinc metalloprotease [Terracidiphilus sp.]|jgi:hypothetical protein
MAASILVPPHRSCGTPEVHHRLLENRAYQQNRIEIERFSSQFMLWNAQNRRTQPITIPVVAHVVYANNTQNISDAQVQSQIVVLNRDYRAANSDKANVPSVWANMPADAQIQFALATTDPDGNPSNGITRTAAGASAFTTDDSVKSTATGGADPWPSDRFLNIWICNLGGGLLGYAQFPGGLAATDGVVILYSAFGTIGVATAPYNLGRTTTHEVGHWLNLIHIWGDRLDCSGTDLVDDTPPQQAPNYGKPAFPHLSCSNGPNGDMFMDFMDYVDDDTMIMFTPGQVSRMAATLDGPRASIAGNIGGRLQSPFSQSLNMVTA